jgi:hypothetical protein
VGGTIGGGGGGANYNTAGASTATGGGGVGGNNARSATAGTANTGGGGGGGDYADTDGAAGGSGCAIAEFLTADFSFTYSGTYTTGTSGSYTWVFMKSSGDLVLTALSAGTTGTSLLMSMAAR